jgi:hypothetical protein
MKQIKTKHLRNYRLFADVTRGLTFSKAAKKNRVSTARSEQIFRFTLVKIATDCDVPEHKISEVGVSTADLIRANKDYWLDKAEKSYAVRTGDKLEEPQ